MLDIRRCGLSRKSDRLQHLTSNFFKMTTPWASRSSCLTVQSSGPCASPNLTDTVVRRLRELVSSDVPNPTRHRILGPSDADSSTEAPAPAACTLHCTLLQGSDVKAPFISSSHFTQPVLDVVFKVPQPPAAAHPAAAAAAAAGSSSPSSAVSGAEDGSDMFNGVGESPDVPAVEHVAAFEWSAVVTAEVWRALSKLYRAPHQPTAGTKRMRDGQMQSTTAFAIMMGAAKEKQACSGIAAALRAGPPMAPAEQGASAKQYGFHKDVLRGYCARDNDAVQHYAASNGVQVLHLDRECVVIQDKYPKAAVHFLVLPRESSTQEGTSSVLRQPGDLRPEHHPLLVHMASVATKLAKAQGCNTLLHGAPTLPLLPAVSPRQAFRVGFHSKPSLFPLHMHCISMDMSSGSLKNKTHFLSFTSTFMVDTSAIIEVLAAGSSVASLLATCPDVSKKDIKQLVTPGLHTPYSRPFSAFVQKLSEEAGQPATIA